MGTQKPLISTMTKAPRLHVDGAVLGFKRGLRTQNNNISLIKIKGVDSKKDAEFYHGKKVAFITKYSNGSSDKKEYRVNWGKVMRSTGPMESFDARSDATCLR